jgi:hypothetical protein
MPSITVDSFAVVQMPKPLPKPSVSQSTTYKLVRLARWTEEKF